MVKKSGLFRNTRPARVTRKRKVLLLLVMALSLLCILIPGTPLLTKGRVEAQLSAFAAQVAQYAQETGNVATFTYGEVTISGMGYNKRARVAGPTLTFTRRTLMGQDVASISTPGMVIVPDTAGAARLSVEFPEPFTLASNDVPQSILTFHEGTLRYAVVREPGSEGPMLRHSLLPPPSFTLKPAPGRQGGDVAVSYAPGAEITSLYTPAQAKSDTRLALRNLSIAETGLTINVASVSSTLLRKPAEGGKLAFDTAFALTDVEVKRGERAYGPYSLKISAEGTRVVAVDGALPPPDTDVQLREFSLAGGKLRVNAKASFSRKADDSLPYGTADVQVENFSAFRDGTDFSPEMRAAVTEALSRIIGADAGKAEELLFSIRREKLGDVLIGSSNVEEVLTAFFSRLLLGAAGPAPTGGDVQLIPKAPDTSAQPETPVNP